MVLTSLIQDDFGAGIFRGRKSPQNAVYDAVNALINDEGLLYRRGGSAYLSDANAGNTLLEVYDEYLQAGQRTVALSSGRLYALNGTTPVDTGGLLAAASARAVGAGGFLVIPTGAGTHFYGGSLKTAAYSTGTVTVTAGSKTVTGSGTSWTANADAGMILRAGSDAAVGLAASVDSNTQITLRDAWSGATAAGASYTLYTVIGVTEYLTLLPEHVAAVGTPPRLILTKGTKAYFTGRGTPTTINLATDYHELPQNAQITGAVGVGDTCVLFTSAGVYAIANMSLDPIDDFGNIQHTVSQVNPSLSLWGDRGLSSFGGGQLVVPATDDVYVMDLSGQAVPITGDPASALRPLYRSYVKAGYQPGLATAHRGHYLLPILNGTSLVDVLVCRMDRDAAWTRIAGHAAGNAYAVRAASSSTAAKLLGISGQRVTDLSSIFDPAAANASDADGTTSDCVITTRDYPTGGNRHGFVQRLRARYELTNNGAGSTPTVTPAFSSDADAGAWTNLTEKGEQGGGSGWATSDGSKFQWVLVGRRRERIRFRLTIAGASGSFILRSLELLLRPQGRQ